MNYAATARKTAAMIRRAGVAMTLRVTTPGYYNPATGTEYGATVTDHACWGVLSNPGTRDSGVTFQDGSMIRVGDKIALVAASDLPVVPQTGDVLVVSSESWTVGPVQTTNPGGVDLLHKCFLRRA